MGRLQGKVAIVTGAGRGIGRGIALEYAREGANLVIADCDKTTIHAVSQEIKELGEEPLTVVCDVGREDQVKKMVSQTAEMFGHVDILVNNAQSWGPVGKNQASIPLIPLEEFPEDVWDYTFQSGVKATLYCSKSVFPHMKAQGGKIINLCSYWGMMGKEGAAAYNANKEAIRGLTRTAAREWGKYRINVNAISPAAETPALSAWAKEHWEEYQNRLETLPLRRYGDPEKDIGRAAVFLASEDANFITGSTIMVDGGLFISS